MQDESRILCVSNAYNEKYYFNERYSSLPEAIRDELKIMCVLYTSDVGGILSLEFSEDGRLLLNVSVDEGDLLFDNVGSVLKIKEIQNKKKDLLKTLELYYKTFQKHFKG